MKNRPLSVLLILTTVLMLIPSILLARDVKLTSPDGRLKVTISDKHGLPTYTVTMDGRVMLTPSALGLKTNVGEFVKGMRITNAKESRIDEQYSLTRAKTSNVHFVANRVDIVLENESGWPLTITFCVTDRDVAYRYTLHRGPNDKPRCAVIYNEASAFNFPHHTTTFICPQSDSMVGWERTKPSYEEEYTPDDRMDRKSRFGKGYTFPCLFHIGNDGWALVSETGTGSNYAGCHLSDYQEGCGYTIAFPDKHEMNGLGSEYVGITLPGSSPWRTITMGQTLKPIVETTIAYDLVKPLYQPRKDYRPGRYTWSWLIWQDRSCNYDDQIRFIDLAAEMGYEYCLVDALWDTQIGREKIEELSRYAQDRGVSLMLWYNSNGWWNDAPQGPRHRMDTSWAREEEMAWMEKHNIAGIKVDFFGSEKQEMMRLYEDILTDANRHGLQVIFHGCTIPRGWERMYPNYVSSEALLASENVRFTDHHARQEGYELCVYPFTRNAIGSADWGGVIMNTQMHKDNKSGHARYTSNVFELASAIVMQTSVNCVALCPNNLTELQDFELDMLREMPTTWDETKLVDGYPGHHVIIARRHADKWYVGGLNGTNEPLTLKLSLPMLAGQRVSCIIDQPVRKGQRLPVAAHKMLKVADDGSLKLTLQPMGGVVIR